MDVGEICCHEQFYRDTTGQLRAKYFLVLARTEQGDVIARLLTSRYREFRPVEPPCHHGDPYPGFFLGILGGVLTRETWLDLRQFDDLDVDAVAIGLRKGLIRPVMRLDSPRLRAAMECAAGADDTTRQQERRIRDALATLR